jgi:hypothetical protein
VTVAFEDSSAEISATFLNLGRPAAIAITPPADGHIHPGSTITLTRSPATDDLSNDTWVLDGPEPTTIDFSQSQGGTLQFTIPASQPTGPAIIRGSIFRNPGVSACVGATACSASWAPLPFPDAPAVFQLPFVNFTVEP